MIRATRVLPRGHRPDAAGVVAIEAPFDPEGGAYAGAGQATVDGHKQPRAFSNMKCGEGVEAVIDFIRHKGGLGA